MTEEQVEIVENAVITALKLRVKNKGEIVTSDLYDTIYARIMKAVKILDDFGISSGCLGYTYVLRFVGMFGWHEVEYNKLTNMYRLMDDVKDNTTVPEIEYPKIIKDCIRVAIRNNHDTFVRSDWELKTAGSPTPGELLKYVFASSM